MTQLIDDLSNLSPHWLTSVLQGTPALADGAVTAFQVVQNLNPPMSVAAAVLRLEYAPGSTGRRPARVFFKIGRRISEVNFNKHIAPATHGVPLVRCLHSEFANEAGFSNLIFEDISETHGTLPEGLPAPRQHTQKFIETLAPLHHQWWENPALAPGGAFHPLRDDLPGFVLRQAREAFPGFINTLGDRLSSKRRGWYERIFTYLPLPAWTERIKNHRGVTLVHGDVQVGNFAIPRIPSMPTYLLDWGLWHVNLPAYDLAYLIALHTYPERRQRFEKEILKQYFISLGLPTYSWSQFWDDYRMSVVFNTVWPVFFHRFTPNHIWYQMLEQIMSAFEDLGCGEFL